MGSSCDANGQNIDPTAGGLVWVRRRNGSWWPGMILGADELPESCSVSSRRLGTPVKLLGREDASVDWYNLEKSKRIKAFRCGEYDECIEQAKYTASVSCKKAVKYARREDAILHALELENSQLMKSNNPKTSLRSDKTKNISDKLSAPQELSGTVASVDNSLEGIRRQTLNDSEDDGTEGSKKRMRGLQDLGVGKAISSFKKKRTRVIHVRNIIKKKDRRHQLTKVLKKTEMLSIPVTCGEHARVNGSGLPNIKARGIGNDELKDSFLDSTGDISNNNANNCKQKEYENSSVSGLLETDDSRGRLFDVPFVRLQKLTAVPPPGKTSLVETTSTEPDGFQEHASTSSGANISYIMDNNGTSKWRHKGKRNSRRRCKTRTMKNVLTPDDDRSRKVNSKVDPRYKSSTDTGDLYDVDIEVKSDHFPVHVPYISLLSNFTGQPVTGHSVEVEVFIDGLSTNSSECLSSSCELVGGVKNDVEKVPETFRKLRKNGLLSNKKIRRLSSLKTGQPSESGMLKRPDSACVPLKVVFGRLNAVLGITSSDVLPTE